MRSGLGTLRCIIAAASDTPILPRALALRRRSSSHLRLHTSALAQTRGILSSPPYSDNTSTTFAPLAFTQTYA
eukprot:4940365-Prymnesium_polylepis.1